MLLDSFMEVFSVFSTVAPLFLITLKTTQSFPAVPEGSTPSIRPTPSLLLPPPRSPCTVPGVGVTEPTGSSACCRCVCASAEFPRRLKHGGVGQREHQPAGFSLSQAPAGCQRRAPARLHGGHLHHAEVRPGRRAPQLPLGLRESRGRAERSDRGAGGSSCFCLSSYKDSYHDESR